VRAGEIGRILGIATVRDRARNHERLFPDVHPALMTAIHDIDVALWITGSRAVRVSAQGRGEGGESPLLVWAQIEAADGTVWAIRVSWLLSDDAPSSDRLEVYGTAGVAKLDLRPTVTLFAERSIWIDHELTPEASVPASVRLKFRRSCRSPRPTTGSRSLRQSSARSIATVPRSTSLPDAIRRRACPPLF
jgi:predicted dehydrogenase